jgi:hypothetical protein
MTRRPARRISEATPPLQYVVSSRCFHTLISRSRCDFSGSKSDNALLLPDIGGCCRARAKMLHRILIFT